jgi:hypothetical protein
LKDNLLQQNTLTKYQRIERLLAVGALGRRCPTQLLELLLELCPDDEEASCFFIFFVLQRLPAKRGSGGDRRSRHLLEPLAVRREGVVL